MSKEAAIRYDIVGYTEVIYTVPDGWTKEDVLKNHENWETRTIEPDSFEVIETDIDGDCEVEIL